MRHQRFPGVAFGGARADTRAAARLIENMLEMGSYHFEMLNLGYGPTSWRAGRARAGWDARHGGGAARRILARAGAVLMAADRSGTTSARCCPGVDLAAALDPVVAKDLVSDGGARHLAPPRSG